MKTTKLVSAIFLCFISCCKLQSATIKVTNTNNTGIGSLRDAIASAASGDIIVFDQNLIKNGSDTIELLSPISITKGLFIKGLIQGKDSLLISGRGLNGIFSIDISSSATFFNVDLDSLVFIDGNGIYGGAVYMHNTYSPNNGNLYIRNCVFRNNKGQNGGAIGAERTSTGAAARRIEIYNTQFWANSSTGNGGAIYIYMRSSGSVEPKIDCIISNSNFISNNAKLNGGAIYTFADNESGSNSGKILISLSRSSVCNNSAGANGGGIYGYGDDSYTNQISNVTFECTTSTIAGNYAVTNGGAFFLNSADISLVKCDISTIWGNNCFSDGSAFYINSRATQNSWTSNAELQMRSSIIGNNAGNNNYNNSVYQNGVNKKFNTKYSNIMDVPKTHFNNITPSASYDSFSIQVNRFKLESLKLNNNNTYTMVPLKGSVLIDNGTTSTSVDAQNGPIVGNRDCGAAEYLNCDTVFLNRNASFCDGSSYKFGKRMLDKEGVYYDTVINLNTCDTITILTLTKSLSVTPSVNITADPGNLFMEGISISFTAIPTNGGPNPSYQWQVNGSNAGMNNAIFTSSNLKNGDLIKCMMNSSAQCPKPTSAVSNSIVCTVHSNNDEPCNAILLPVNNKCVTSFYSTSAAGKSSGIAPHSCASQTSGDIWFKFKTPASGKLNIFTYPGTLSDAVLSVYLGNCNTLFETGCADDDGMNKMPQGLVSNATPDTTYFIRVSGKFALSGSFAICLVDSSSKLSTIGLLSDINLHPNPASDFITINLSGTQQQDITMFTPQGKLVFRQVLPPGKHSIPLSNWAEGVYIVRTSDSQGTVTSKFLLQRK